MNCSEYLEKQKGTLIFIQFWDIPTSLGWGVRPGEPISISSKPDSSRNTETLQSYKNKLMIQDTIETKNNLQEKRKNIRPSVPSGQISY